MSHRRLPTASLSPGILVPCYCGSGTQERPDGTQYFLGCAASVDHTADVNLKSHAENSMALIPTTSFAKLSVKYAAGPAQRISDMFPKSKWLQNKLCLCTLNPICNVE